MKTVIRRDDLECEVSQRLFEILGDASPSKRAQSATIAALINSIMWHVEQGDEVRVGRLGTFLRKRRAARTGRNPHTGEPVPIPERNMPGFQPTKEFVEIVSRT